MRYTKRNENQSFYLIVKRNVFVYDIVERISEIETEMEMPEAERWTKGKSLKGNMYEHVYELIQRLGQLEDDLPRFRQRRKIREKILSCNKFNA